MVQTHTWACKSELCHAIPSASVPSVKIPMALHDILLTALQLVAPDAHAMVLPELQAEQLKLHSFK